MKVGQKLHAQAATEPAGILRRVQPELWNLVCEEGWPEAARSSGYEVGWYSEACQPESWNPNTK